MTKPKTRSAPVSAEYAVAAGAPSMSIRTTPLVTRSNAGINISEALSSVSCGSIAQLLQPVGEPVHFSRPSIPAFRTATSLKNLSRFGIPSMSVRTLEMVPYRATEIIAFEAGQVAFRQRIKKLLSHFCLHALRASCRAAGEDECLSLKLVSACAPEPIVGSGIDPRLGQERESGGLRHLFHMGECFLSRACHINYRLVMQMGSWPGIIAGSSRPSTNSRRIQRSPPRSRALANAVESPSWPSQTPATASSAVVLP
ncbi:hypothetical protein [Burkholderia stagnalis]